MSVCVYSVVLIISLHCYVGIQTEVLMEESSAIHSLRAPTGGVVELPCDVTPGLAGDKMSLVIWYKQGHVTPIYSFDIRESVTSHWSDPSTLGARAIFRSDADPAVLVLTKLRPEDSGQYRCRVDFLKAPTKNTRLNLTVLIPPERLIILSQGSDELQNGILGPYDEGTPVNATCVAVGGQPPPRVSWWRSHALLANSEGRATVSLTLQRRDHAARLTCQAVTDPSMPPVSEVISIDVNLPVLWLRLLGGKRPLVAGQSSELVCQAAGARPKPSLSWWKDGIQLNTARETVSTDGNITTSTLKFTPSIEDDGHSISCRAAHATLPHSTHEDGWKMEIQHVPVVAVSLGAGLVSGDILERSDVYLDCNVQANPPHTHLYFTRNGVIVKPGHGVLLANQSLVLQKVSRQSKGDYVCIARNNLGEGFSEKLSLDVKYPPSCKNSQLIVLRAARGELIDINCDVDANPKVNMSYEWRFNSSSKAALEQPITMLHSSHYNKLRNMALKVNSTSDYGWLQCSATNAVGRQQSPCVFQILPAEKPAKVKGCEITNVTFDALTVSCTPGHDGGVKQAFLLQITDTSTGILLRNMSRTDPVFHVTELHCASSLFVSIAAYNKRGVSEPVTLSVELLKYPQQQHTASGQESRRTMLVGAVTSVGALAALAIVVTVAYCCRTRTRYRDNEKDKSRQEETSNMPLTSNKGADSLESLDKNPDIIPLNRKTSDSHSRISSTTDNYSQQPLISLQGKYDVTPNCARFHDQNIDSNLYIYPMEYGDQYIPVQQPIMNLRPSVQGTGSFGNVANEYSRKHDKMYEDWLNSKNGLPLNTSTLFPREEEMPSELYPPPILYSNPPLLPELENRLHFHRPLDCRIRSSTPHVRFQDNCVYFNESVLEETSTLPGSR